MMGYFDDEDDAELKHIGTKRHSGRYPWGSGNNPYQRASEFKKFIEELRTKGMSQTAIARFIQDYMRQSDPHATFSTNDLRGRIANSTEIIRQENINTARKLKATQMSTSAIGREMGVRESTVRGWLKASEDVKEGSIRATADKLKEEVGVKKFLDVGKGNHLYLGITYTKLQTALGALRDEGYEVHPVKIKQLGTDQMTNAQVLCKPGTSWSEARKAVVNGDLRVIAAQSDDGGLTYHTAKEPPPSISSKKIAIRYADEGGKAMDGVIELRRNVPELDLGESRYGQVRIAVDGTHYLKGMAIYADDLPAGVNMRVNSNKTKAEVGPEKTAVMKPMKTLKDGSIDQEHPFGSTTHPHIAFDEKGKPVQTFLNVVGSKPESGNIEGRWDQWSNSLSSQMLSKQPVALASKQLGIARKQKEQDLNDIMAMTNPVVRKKLLEEYADGADAAAAHLKAASLDRQSTHVLLPMNSMRRHEIYAPNFDNGEKVVLVRHPHGGPFEIPELTVNNKNLTAKRILGNARDAVGIHHTVAEQLSGADFDGDTVLVIPNPTGSVKHRPPLEQLKGFDAKIEYKITDDDTTTTRMTKQNLQTEMGKISNLITDMTIKGANDTDLANAVKHSMVIIDSEKHGLDYKRSAEDHGIARLKETYQAPAKGASTIISKAGATERVPQRKYLTGARGIDPKTGEKVFIETGNKRTVTKTTVSKKTGEEVTKTSVIDKQTKGQRMDFVDDARKLLSENPKPMEEVYAAHANAMKDLANKARLNTLELYKGLPKESPAAKSLYSKEVESLNAKLMIAHRNAPLERRAQALGGAMARTRIENNPTVDKDEIKKIQYQSLSEARTITGADKVKVFIEDREWEAIQARALSPTKLGEILSQADMDRVKTLATPKYHSSLTPGQLARAKQMASSGRPMSDIAAELGIPRSTLVDNLANG